MEKIRAIKYCIPKNTQLVKFCEDYYRALKDINKLLFKSFKSGKITWLDTRKTKKKTRMELKNSGMTDDNIENKLKKFKVDNGYKLPIEIWDECNKILQRYNFLNENKYFLHSIIGYILDRYKSYLRRFKEKDILCRTSPINFNKNKAIFIGRHIIKDQNLYNSNGKLLLSGWKNKKGIEFEYTDIYSSKSNKLCLQKSDSGGYLKYKNNKYIYTVRVNIEYTPLYQPVDAIGFDINDTDMDWLVFSGYLTTIEQPARKIIDQIDECTKQRNNKELKSSQRRFFNKKAKKLHNKLKNIYRPIVNTILDCVEQNKLLLCIDKVACGTGTFGADQLRQLLITECENKCIPFIIVPAKNTSRTCHECGNVDKDARISAGVYICTNKSCKLYDTQQNAQKNAAINIKNKGLSSYNSSK